MDKQYEEIKANLETLGAKLKQAPPDPVEPDADDKMKDIHNRMANLHDHMSNMHQNLSAAMNYIHNRMSSIDNHHQKQMDDHKNNSTHLPKLNASQTEKLLKSCGAAEDFTVVKPSIHAAKVNNRLFVEAEYKKS